MQVSETYNPENPVQIITAALPQPASESDQNAVTTMLEKMEKAGAKPEILLADSGYGSDEYDARSLRLRERRLHEKTEEFREDYRMRSGEEALFGRLKQFTPLRRLGIRGKTAVYNTIYSITAVRNIMQMAGFYKKQRRQKQKMTANKPKMASFTTFFSQLCQYIDL